MVSHKFQPRTRWLPQPGQTYLELPGVRPDRGPCPVCKVAEDLYCANACTLVDPYAKDSAERLDKCLICSLASLKRNALHDLVLLNAKRTVRHLVEPDLARSLCHMIHSDRGALLVRGCRW